MTDTSAVALRTMGPRAILSGNGDALDNINTFELPDGAECFVVANRTNYRLDKLSVAAPAPPDIIAPSAGGPGRWIADSSGGGGDTEPLSSVRYADLDTVVPLADQNGAIVLPFSTLAALIVDLEALPNPERTGLITPGDYSAEGTLTINEDLSLQSIRLPISNPDLGNHSPPVVIDTIEVDTGDSLYLLGINVINTVDMGGGSTLSAIDCEIAALTGDAEDAAILYFRTSWLGTITTGNASSGSIECQDCTIDGNLTGGVMILRQTRFQPGFTITCDLLTIDVTSWTNGRMVGVTFNVGAMTFSDGPVPFEAGAETGVIAVGDFATVTFTVPGIIPPAKAVVTSTNFPGLVGVMTAEPCGVVDQLDVTIRNFDANPFDEELFICGLWFHDPSS